MAMQLKRYCLFAIILFVAFLAPVKAQDVDFTSTNITCNNADDGTITATIDGGSSTYKYVRYNIIDPADSSVYGPTSELTHIFTGLEPGTWVAYVRDLASADDPIFGILTLSEPAPIVSSFSATKINCFGAATGIITFTPATGGSGNFDYTIDGTTWFNGQTTFSGLTSKNYFIAVRDHINQGCLLVLNAAYLLDQNPQLNATLTFSNPQCYNTSNGSITIASPTGGTGSFQYTITGANPWTAPAATGYTYNSLARGTYNVVMRDAGAIGCTRTLNGALVLDDPDELTVNISINKGLTCFEGSDGRLQANVTGGTAPYTYTWARWNGSVFVPNGQTGPIATNLNQGRYQITVNDSRGCGPRTGTIFFVFGPAPGFGGDSIPPMFYYDGSTAITACQGQTNGSIDMSAHGGVKPYRFSITTGGASGYQNDSLFINLAAGSYQPWVMDDRGCKKTGANVIVATTPNAPVSVTVTPSVVGSFCPGTSVIFTANPVNGGTTPTYQWRLNGNPVGANQNTYTNAALINNDQVTVTVTSNLRCTTGNPATSAPYVASVLVPVTITGHPASQTLCAGSNVTFTVIATGSSLSYQWLKNGVNIGGNSPSLTLNNITITDAATYTVRVSNTCGTVTSNPAILTVNTVPAISDQPDNTTVCSGGSANFAVTASGGNLTYEWRRNGVAVGTNAPTLALTGVTPAMAGNYTVYISNSCGNVTSAIAVLTVNTAPAISDQPDNVTVCSGGNATFTVVASGGDLTYQWRRNGVNVGSNSPTLSLTGVTPAMAGNYTVFVSNTCGNVTSAIAVLTVNTIPAISDQPDNTTVCSGATATFTVTASGGDLTYQWRRNGVNVGSNSPTLSLAGVTPAMAGNYDVFISNSCGNVTSTVAVLTVNTTPAITDQPDNLTVCSGANASFSVTATGGNLTYEWRRNGVAVPGGNSATLNLTGVTPAMAGNYTVYISNSCGNITSAVAVLTVNTIPAISDQPDNVTVCSGGTADFSVTASGGALTYQWRRNGVNVGGNSPTLSLAGVTPAMAGNYDVFISNSCGNVTSTIAVLTVNTIPAIADQPDDATVCSGGTATFQVTASGGNLTYQWRRNGVNVGSNSATLTLTPVTPAMAGNYDVFITNACGNVTSTVAVLTVNTTPAITDQPDNVTVCSGANASFSVTATGGNLTYEWRRNGVAVPGGNTATLNLAAVTPAIAGNYTVYISNACGNITSGTAVLTVNTVPVISDQPDNLTVCSGGNATFSVTASGGNLTYQWRRNGVNVGGNSATLNLTAVTPAMAGNYDVFISNPCGNVTSTVAVLTVNTTPSITDQPDNLTVCSGDNASFSVTATGGNLSYEWRRNGVAVPGGNTANLNLAAVTPAMAGNYTVYISNTCGNITSATAVLTVNTVPAISDQPDNATACEGGNASFTVVASGGGLTYEWRHDGNIVGTNAATLSLTGVTAAMAGNYTVTITNSCGNVTSVIATLIVNSIPAITTQPADIIECAGGNVVFSVDASGLNLAYQWRRNGTALPGQISNTLNINNITAANAGNYTVTITNECGTVTSSTAVLTVNTAPVITLQPIAVTECAGSTVTFTADASGESMGVIWRRNGIPIPGENDTILVINNINNGHAGNYDAVFTNPCGTATTNAVVLTVAQNPVIVAQPIGAVLCEGGDVSLTVNATGTGLTYQWRKDGTNIPGETGFTLDLTAVTLSDAGNYTVAVYGMCDTIISNPALVTVNPATTADITEKDTIVCAGSNVDFNVVADGFGLISYQWQLFFNNAWVDISDNAKYSGTNTAQLSITDAQAADSGYYRCQVVAGCGTNNTGAVRFDVNVMVVTIGTPAPFMINSATTGIEVSLKVSNHFLIFDMGFSLVAPDGTEVMLKYPIIDPCVYNTPVNVDATFNNALPPTDSMDYCLATSNITGTFGAVGDWSVLDGMDPSNGAWQVRVYDQDRAVLDPDGFLTAATLRFTDLDIDGDTAVVSYNSGVISEGIINPIASEMHPTSFVVPIRLMTSCFNTEDARAVVTIDGGVPPFTYVWTGPTVEDNSAQVDLGPGTYTVTVMDNIGCTAQASVEVTAPPAILFDDVQHTDTLACFDAAEGIIRAKAIGGSGGFTYTLLPGNIPSSVADSGVFTGLTAGAYTVRATDINDCSFDTVIHIYQRAQLVVDIATVPVIGINKGSITLLASGGLPPYQFSIDNGTTMQDSGQFLNLDAGIYQILVMDSAGCIFTDEVNLNVEMLDLDVTSHDVSCPGLADGDFFIALTDGVGPYTLTGPFTDTLTVDNGFFSFTNQTAGSYPVKVEDSAGSVFIETIVINEPLAIVALETITRPDCPNIAGGSIELDVTGGTGTLIFEWEDGTTTEDRLNIAEGNYSVRITDEEDCYAEFSYTVDALDPVEAMAGIDQVLCPGDTAELSGNIGDSVKWSYIRPDAYQWISDSTTSAARVYTSRDVNMLYTVYSNGCSDIDTLRIDIDGPYGVFITRDPESPDIDTAAYLLEGETIRLTVFYVDTLFSGHEWLPNEGILFPYDPLRFVADIKPTESALYRVRAWTILNGCIEYGNMSLTVASTINVYNAFSPNGDGVNDTWEIQNAVAYGERINVKVFNRWGEPVFESRGYGGTNQWDGTRNGKMMPVGSYYYIINVTDGKSEPFTGTVTLLR
jgi:gliding motility-associated-like protein